MVKVVWLVWLQAMLEHILLTTPSNFPTLPALLRLTPTQLRCQEIPYPGVSVALIDDSFKFHRNVVMKID